MEKAQKKILVVDDEQDIAEILQFNLQSEGYEVDVAFSAEEALQKIIPSPTLPHPKEDKEATAAFEKIGQSTHSQAVESQDWAFDLILLDVMMGEISGFGLARLLKQNPSTAEIPIIFITALDGEEETVRGLDLGADDYIPKPLSMKEVKARVRAVLRRTAVQRTGVRLPATAAHEPSEPKAELLTFEGIEINLDDKSAKVDGKAVTLTHLEFELLVFFLQHQGRVYSRFELLNRLWPKDTFVLERTVDVNITRLRKKIAPYGEQIKTKIGYGYYFRS